MMLLSLTNVELFLCIAGLKARTPLASRVQEQGDRAPETPQQEAERVAYNIAFNKAFVNLDMRAYKARGLFELIMERYQTHYNSIVKAREKSKNPVLPLKKVKKPKKVRTSNNILLDTTNTESATEAAIVA